MWHVFIIAGDANPNPSLDLKLPAAHAGPHDGGASRGRPTLFLGDWRSESTGPKDHARRISTPCCVAHGSRNPLDHTVRAVRVICGDSDATVRTEVCGELTLRPLTERAERVERAGPLRRPPVHPRRESCPGEETGREGCRWRERFAKKGKKISAAPGDYHRYICTYERKISTYE